MLAGEEVEFTQLTAHPEYEITTSYPFIVRRKKDSKIMKQSQNNVGYLYVSINGNNYELHRIIAEQFVLNKDPQTNTEIDHINGVKTDNRIENLEWITHAENCRRRKKINKKPNEYIESIEGLNVIPIIEYNKMPLDRYYYDVINEKIYLKTRAKKDKSGSKSHYKVVQPCFHNNLNIITLMTADKKSKSYSYNKFLKFCKDLSQTREEQVVKHGPTQVLDIKVVD